MLTVKIRTYGGSPDTLRLSLQRERRVRESESERRRKRGRGVREEGHRDVVTEEVRIRDKD